MGGKIAKSVKVIYIYRQTDRQACFWRQDDDDDDDAEQMMMIITLLYTHKHSHHINKNIKRKKRETFHSLKEKRREIKKKLTHKRK